MICEGCCSPILHERPVSRPYRILSYKHGPFLRYRYWHREHAPARFRTKAKES